MFQFTHPCGCDIPTVLVGIPCSGFNSRTRVGATPFRLPLMIISGVSIHAPVWVRQFLENCGIRITGFQFTHPCGCDLTPAEAEIYGAGFNSRTRVGATSSNGDDPGTLKVSIHAPVWVRLFRSPLLSHTRRFNSRTRVGATLAHRGNCHPH